MSRREAKFIVIAALAGGLAAGLCKPAFLARPVLAKPSYMDRYNRDPYSKPEWMGKCNVCHIGRGGGGERNDFGEAFEDAGYRITPKLRAKFPDLFQNKKTPSN